MGIFGKIRSKLFGSSTPVLPHFRPEKEAKVEVKGQTARRQALLARRVAAGQSSQVYPNRKDTATGDSPYIQDFLDGFQLSRFASSCVYSLVYDKIQRILHVQWLGKSGKKRVGPGRWTGYVGVDESEAKIAYNTASKGIFSWVYLRRAQKQFIRDLAPGKHLPYGRKRANILRGP